MLIIDLVGLTLTDNEKINLLKPSVAGVILFGRNFKNIEQVKRLIQSIRKINADLLITVDHEGGRVQRFKEGFTHLPAMARLGKVYDENPNLALQQATSCGWILAAELLEIGVDFSFTPVLDLDYGSSSVIGDRAFHTEPEVIVKLAGALIDGMHEAGMKCVGKHFPGHGFVVADSHLDLPIDERSMDEIERDLSVFSRLNDKLDGIMPAHVVYPQVDDKPAGFSKIWLDKLRQDLNFKGVIFSDDLSMQGAHFIKNITERVQVSLDSGCDIVLICNHPELVAQVIDQDWGVSEKHHSMRGIKPFNFDKIAHHHHLQTIQDLL
ncbi:Beta N-acetyl-glucosaminidase [uncultured Candidatus Thioglobus sp.]|nr:Beta N-acetyl-glucosaminidase [uncultured Candidatus Thioglobus sp.]